MRAIHVAFMTAQASCVHSSGSMYVLYYIWLPAVCLGYSQTSQVNGAMAVT